MARGCRANKVVLAYRTVGVADNYGGPTIIAHLQILLPQSFFASLVNPRRRHKQQLS